MFTFSIYGMNVPEHVRKQKWMATETQWAGSSTNVAVFSLESFFY